MMRIRIRTDACRLWLPVPNSVLTGPLGRAALGKARNAAGEPWLTARQIEALQRELRRAKTVFGSLVLVEVHTAQQDIKITL